MDAGRYGGRHCWETNASGSWELESHIEARGSQVPGAELTEEQLLVPGDGPRARHPDGLCQGRHRATVERVVRVLHAQPTPRALGR